MVVPFHLAVHRFDTPPRMRTIVIAVVFSAAVLGGVAWWVLRDVEPPAILPVAVNTPTQPLPVVAPAELPTVAEVPTAPVAAEPSAAPGEDTISLKVLRGAVTEVGTRITLKQGTVRVSGLTDVMGVARLQAGLGRWEVLPQDAGDRPSPPVLEVTRPGQSLEVTLPANLRLQGNVALEDGSSPGVCDLAIYDAAGSMEFPRWRRQTASTGDFDLLLAATEVTMKVTCGVLTSDPRRFTLPFEGMAVLVEAHAPVTVRVSGVGSANPHVALVQRGGRLTVCTGRSSCVFDARLGPAMILASAMLGSQARSARLTGEVKPLGWVAKLELKAAPPISGRVHDDGGKPLAGVTVLLRTIAEPGEGRAESRALTLADGSFSLAPERHFGAVNDLELQTPWKLDHQVHVLMGDEPLDLTALPVTGTGP